MHEVLFYLLIWIVSCAASVCRGLRDDLNNNIWVYLSGGATSGFCSFGIIAVWSTYSNVGPGNHAFWIGASALLGILGKEQDAILRWLLGKVFPIDTESKAKSDGDQS
ncbi:hypothetical protein SH449x_004102 [Pirellulaceae bacterium SH449]